MNAVVEKLPNAIKQAGYGLSVADAVWIAAAICQRETQLGPEHQDGFEFEVLRMMVTGLNLTNAEQGSIMTHIRQHCVANKEPQPNRSCVLFATDDRHRRLYRRGDPRHPGREGAPAHPKWDRLPEAFKDLQEWYETIWNAPSAMIASDPLLNAIGTGRELWKDVGADVYVREIREGWDSHR